MIREFFGFGGYTREAEGFLSWQHIAFVSALMAIMVISAVILGRKNKIRDEKAKNRVLIAAALIMDGVELLRIILLCVFGGNPMAFLYNLPLFMCSIQMITLPLAAFSKGRIREAAMDFVCIFGIFGAVLGTYGAGNNYGSYPVICFDNVISGITHASAGFASLYIMITGMARMKRKNIVCTFAIIISFCIAAYIANILLDYNYMFLMRGDGTPYDILYNLVSGHKVIYPAIVLGLFLVYILIFYAIWHCIRRRKEKKLCSPIHQN